MAEIKKLNSKRKNDNSQEDFSFDDFLTMLQQKLGIDIDSLMEDEPEEADNEDDYYSEEDYLYGLKLPKHKFIGTSKREYHIRIKLNDAPVKIWRELVVPSNITLELLAFVLIDAMGWAHEHLYQFRGKNDVIYMNSHEIREHKNSFFGFLSRVQYVNTETTSLDMVLQPKGGRFKFEYDMGDSWIHDVWVKGARDYAKNEEPVIKLLKAEGACPPEDCGGVWGYAELIELKNKKRKTAEDKERLEWYDISKDYNPKDCDLESLQDDVEALWLEIKDEMDE